MGIDEDNCIAHPSWSVNGKQKCVPYKKKTKVLNIYIKIKSWNFKNILTRVFWES